MTFHIVYNDAYKRVIPAVLTDSRGSIVDIQAVGGFALKAYNDLQVSNVTSTVLPYKIETEYGNIAGYFNLQVNKLQQTVSLKDKQLRPAFINFDADISNEIGIFISNNKWKTDYLF